MKLSMTVNTEYEHGRKMPFVDMTFLYEGWWEGWRGLWYSHLGERGKEGGVHIYEGETKGFPGLNFLF